GCGKVFFDLSLFSLLTSIACGIWCVIHRLSDFRNTRGIARAREDLESENKTEKEINEALKERRAKSKTAGQLTWTLLRVQLVMFGIGAGFLSLAFVITYRAKLLW